MDLGIDVQHQEKTTIVNLSGEIDVYTAPKFKESLINLIEEGFHDIVVNLQEVTFMDSTGLGALVGGLKRIKPLGGSLVLICNQDKILKIFEITGLNKVFPIYQDADQAIKALS